MVWTSFAADVPRYIATANGLLIEGSRTNLVRNPRMLGAAVGVVGASGSLPTNATLNGGGTHTLTVLATGTIGGLPYIDLDLTSSASATTQINLDLSMNVTANPSATFTQSLFCQIIGGATTNFSVFGARRRVSTSTVDVGATTSMLGASTTALQRFTSPLAILADSTNVQFQVILTTTGAGALQFRLAAPQYELGAFASTPILNASGDTSNTPTRSGDLVSCTLASAGIAASGDCTLLWSGMIPQNAPSGVDQTLFQIDDGSASNRYRVRNAAGGATIVGGRVLSGSSSDASSAGSMTAGTAFAVGASITGGRIAISFNGGSVVAATGGPTSGLTSLRVGNDTAATAALFGETRYFRSIATALSDSELRSAVGALPTT